MSECPTCTALDGPELEQRPCGKRAVAILSLFDEYVDPSGPVCGERYGPARAWLQTLGKGTVGVEPLPWGGFMG